MNFLKKNILKILNIALVVGVGIYTLAVAVKNVRDYEIYSQEQTDARIYVVWNVETFEGGGKSRITYLKEIAREIESSNAGVLFLIKTISPDSLKAELEVSQPDIISFGTGVGLAVLPYLSELSSECGVRGELANSGKYGGKLYALAYIASGYALISHGATSVQAHGGNSGYTNLNPILADLDLELVDNNESQYEAYKAFVYDKNALLLGTGRDVYRISNLNNIGRLNAMIYPIDSYTDLVQYMGLTKADEVTELFLNTAVSEKYQSKLSEYSLFPTTEVKLYSSGVYQSMEDAIWNCEVKNVFS